MHVKSCHNVASIILCVAILIKNSLSGVIIHLIWHKYLYDLHFQFPTLTLSSKYVFSIIIIFVIIILKNYKCYFFLIKVSREAFIKKIPHFIAFFSMKTIQNYSMY
jgi:hypothetical protein